MLTRSPLSKPSETSCRGGNAFLTDPFQSPHFACPFAAGPLVAGPIPQRAPPPRRVERQHAFITFMVASRPIPFPFLIRGFPIFPCRHAFRRRRSLSPSFFYAYSFGGGVRGEISGFCIDPIPLLLMLFPFLVVPRPQLSR